MSDTKNKARELLQRHALMHARSVTGKYDYLPETDEEAAMFEPHQWAISAVVEAMEISDSEHGK